MSLLDRKHQELKGFPQIKTKNAYGTWDLTDGPPFTFWASVQSVTVEEAAALNVSATTTKRCIGRGPWMGGTHTVIEWAGRRWDAKGEDREYLMSRRTEHFDIIIQAQTAEVK